MLQRRNYLVTTEKKVSPNFSALKTLVVDDDVAVCESAVATQEIGVTAEWVGSGRKAIERVQALWSRQTLRYDSYRLENARYRRNRDR